MTFETCRWCAAFTSQDWEVLWPVLVLLRDVVALWAAAALLTAATRCWRNGCKPCIEDARRRRVGIAEGLNASLSVVAEQPAQAAAEPEAAIVAGFVVEGAMDGGTHTGTVDNALSGVVLDDDPEDGKVTAL